MSSRPCVIHSLLPLCALLWGLSAAQTAGAVAATAAPLLVADSEPSNRANTPTAAPDPDSAPDQPDRIPGAAEAAPPPAQELSADLLYAVLVAEIATQRSDHAMAFTHYLHAARLARDPALAELAARAALTQDDPQAAQRAATLWVKLAPTSSKAQQITAFALLKAGDRAGAQAALEQVVALARTPARGYMQAVQLLAGLPDVTDRVALMRTLVEAQPEDADAQFALATLAATTDDSETALAATSRAAELRPGWTKPRLFQVRILLGEDRMDDALAALEAHRAAIPEDAELSMLRAQFHIEAEQYAEALVIFDQMLTQGVEQAEVLFAAAVLALQIEDIDAARQYLEGLRETGARPADTAFLFGQMEELADNPDLAIDWYAQVSGDNATNAQVRIASIRAQRGEIAAAREQLQQLRVQYPGQSITLYLIEAELLRDQQQREEAIEVLGVALAADPDHPDLLYARAMLAVALDRLDVLEADLRRILIRDPDHADALNALGYTLADRTDRLDEAHRFIERALQLRPEEPAVLDSMGWVLYRMGDAAAAEPYLRRALDKLFDAEIAAHLGEVLWELGRHDEARLVWQRALDADPHHEYLLQVLGRYRFSHTGN